MLLFSSRALLAVTNQSPITIKKNTCMHDCIEIENNTTSSFLMANMVSGVDQHQLSGTWLPYSLGLIIHI